jgi:hypothetical protein
MFFGALEQRMINYVNKKDFFYNQNITSLTALDINEIITDILWIAYSHNLNLFATCENFLQNIFGNK